MGRKGNGKMKGKGITKWEGERNERKRGKRMGKGGQKGNGIIRFIPSFFRKRLISLELNNLTLRNLSFSVNGSVKGSFYGSLQK